MPVEFIAPQDCDNAPKKRIIRDFYLDIAKGDILTAMSRLSEDVKLEVPGHTSITGQQAVATQLKQDNASIKKLTLETILSHGQLGAVNGVFEFSDGGTVEFGTFIAFSSHAKDAKIQSLKTYSIINAQSKSII